MEELKPYLDKLEIDFVNFIYTISVTIVSIIIMVILIKIVYKKLLKPLNDKKKTTATTLAHRSMLVLAIIDECNCYKDSTINDRTQLIARLFDVDYDPKKPKNCSIYEYAKIKLYEVPDKKGQIKYRKKILEDIVIDLENFGGFNNSIDKLKSTIDECKKQL